MEIQSRGRVKRPKKGKENAMPGSTPRSACSTAARATAEWRPSCSPHSRVEQTPSDSGQHLEKAKSVKKL